VRRLLTIRHRIRVLDGAEYLTVGQINVSDVWITKRTAEAGFLPPTKFSPSESAPRAWQLYQIEQWECVSARINRGVS
jgi:hypothetical protein